MDPSTRLKQAIQASGKSGLAVAGEAQAWLERTGHTECGKVDKCFMTYLRRGIYRVAQKGRKKADTDWRYRAVAHVLPLGDEWLVSIAEIQNQADGSNLTPTEVAGWIEVTVATVHKGERRDLARLIVREGYASHSPTRVSFVLNDVTYYVWLRSKASSVDPES